MEKNLKLVFTIIIFAIGIMFTLIQMGNGRTEVLEGRIYELVQKAGDTNTKVGTMEGNIETIMRAIVSLESITYNKENGKIN